MEALLNHEIDEFPSSTNHTDTFIYSIHFIQKKKKVISLKSRQDLLIRQFFQMTLKLSKARLIKTLHHIFGHATSY